MRARLDTALLEVRCLLENTPPRWPEAASPSTDP